MLQAIFNEQINFWSTEIAPRIYIIIHTIGPIQMKWKVYNEAEITPIDGAKVLPMKFWRWIVDCKNHSENLYTCICYVGDTSQSNNNNYAGNLHLLRWQNVLDSRKIVNINCNNSGLVWLCNIDKHYIHHTWKENKYKMWPIH